MDCCVKSRSTAEWVAPSPVLEEELCMCFRLVLLMPKTDPDRLYKLPKLCLMAVDPPREGVRVIMYNYKSSAAGFVC